jgi:hypothetical protein
VVISILRLRHDDDLHHQTPSQHRVAQDSANVNPAHRRNLGRLKLSRVDARERVVPILELVFGNLTQIRSSLEPSLGIAAIAGPSCIVIMHDTYKLLKWRIRRLQTGPQKDLGRIGPELNVVPFPFYPQNQQQR